MEEIVILLTESMKRTTDMIYDDINRIVNIIGKLEARITALETVRDRI